MSSVALSPKIGSSTVPDVVRAALSHLSAPGDLNTMSEVRHWARHSLRTHVRCGGQPGWATDQNGTPFETVHPVGFVRHEVLVNPHTGATTTLLDDDTREETEVAHFMWALTDTTLVVPCVDVQQHLAVSFGPAADAAHSEWDPTDRTRFGAVRTVMRAVQFYSDGINPTAFQDWIPLGLSVFNAQYIVRNARAKMVSMDEYATRVHTAFMDQLAAPGSYWWHFENNQAVAGWLLGYEKPGIYGPP